MSNIVILFECIKLNKDFQVSKQMPEISGRIFFIVTHLGSDFTYKLIRDQNMRKKQ